MEWSLVYSKEEGVLLPVFAKSKGKDKLQLEKMFMYGRLRNIDYEDSELPNLLLEVERSGGIRRVLVDEGNLVAECCGLKMYRRRNGGSWTQRPRNVSWSVTRTSRRVISVITLAPNKRV